MWFRMSVERMKKVLHMSPTEGGRNYFRVEAIMDKHSDLTRPGLEGVAKIEIGQEKSKALLPKMGAQSAY